MENFLEISSLSKKFRSNYALKDVSLSLRRGEVLGLVGANGSGKTTLVNILAGNPVIADSGGFSGKIRLEGKSISPVTPSDSLSLGICMVHQEFALIPAFTAHENIMLGRENKLRPFQPLVKTPIPIIDLEKNIREADAILSGLGLKYIDPHAPVKDFNVSVRQFIEFARVLNADEIKLLILDEPTAVLGREESLKIIGEVRRLAEQGVSVIFISHRIEEVLSLCSRIAVLRDGVLTAVFNTPETTAEEIAFSMLGSIKTKARKAHFTERSSLESFFRIKDMKACSGGESLNDFSLDVAKGEILGITGQSGQGQMLIGKAIMGLIPAEADVFINGTKVITGDSDSLFNSGFYYIPEERRKDGLLPDHSVAENIAFTLISTRRAFTSGAGLLNFRKIDKSSQSYIKAMDIKCTGPGQKVCELSGGNQQKVILARALLLSPEIMMIFEPTRGIDIGAKEMILDMLLDMNRKLGTTIIIVSSELDELIRTCDRIAVLYEGKVVSVLAPDQPSENFAYAFTGRSLQ